MPTGTHYESAIDHLDRASANLRRDGDGAATETHAQVGLGYALLALMDEVEKLGRATAATTDKGGFSFGVLDRR